MDTGFWKYYLDHNFDYQSYFELMIIAIQMCYYRTIGIIACFFLTSVSSSGQVIIEALPRWLISTHFNYSIPGQPVKKLLNGNHLGYQVEIQYRLQYNKPFLAGGYYNEATLSKYVLKYMQSSADGGLDIREKANTQRLEGGLTAGFYPEVNWLLQPYIQGRMGFAVFQSSSILTDRDTGDNVDNISESTTVVPAYGLDLGVHIVPNIWYIRGDFRVGFVRNTSTSFLILDKENAGTTEFPIEYFDEHTSAGNWWKISVGISFLF